MFEATVDEGVCQLRRPGTRWLSTGANGGESVADAAYNLTVPEGWPETDLAAYVREHRDRAGFAADGPALLTGVDQTHARRARRGPVEVIATAGVSNPAALPVGDFEPGPVFDGKHEDDEPNRRSSEGSQADSERVGTVNLVVGTTRALAPGALANLVAVAAEAKAATLLAATGFPGTTTDAVVVGCDPGGDPAAFSGSATVVGDAARVCVRDAVLASLESRYSAANRRAPESVAAAEYGVVADGEATVSRLTPR
ncbi:adenosylcobinamide amidohydrolase [Halorarum halophilum]|uniref:Adenosylcobinamide amidohydrolase n=1 Tax=Halorarum halophilum TaxID=2743090 RepID=A0A7D5H338_9EURY|nr:adenosylcobinamide amidohydrolase [Halobaculum halophilum]QLG29553.1 adenosylcobinamide amidohydrolase [Halobaculum halophilum]